MQKPRDKRRFFLLELANKIGELIDGYRQEPLTVSIMGQTGVGKSSLINALFGTNLPTDPVRPGTTRIEEDRVMGKNGHEVIFYDFPGLGESDQADQLWIPEYHKHLKDSDIVIWAVVADTRSFGYDLNTLKTVITDLPSNQKVYFLSKIVFVLTKTDLLTNPEIPVHWFLVKLGEDNSFFLPDENLDNLIKRKEKYFREKFIDPFKHLIKPQTFYKGTFKMQIPHMVHRHNIVSYDGFVEEADYEKWCEDNPNYKAVFRRLYESCRIIPCSTRFRYNLDLLINVIIEKLDIQSAGRFEGFVEQKKMGRMPYMQAKDYVNIIPIPKEAFEKLKEES